MPLPGGLRDSPRNGVRVFSFSWRIREPYVAQQIQLAERHHLAQLAAQTASLPVTLRGDNAFDGLTDPNPHVADAKHVFRYMTSDGLRATIASKANPVDSPQVPGP